MAKQRADAKAASIYGVTPAIGYDRFRKREEQSQQVPVSHANDKTCNTSNDGDSLNMQSSSEDEADFPESDFSGGRFSWTDC